MCQRLEVLLCTLAASSFLVLGFFPGRRIRFLVIRAQRRLVRQPGGKLNVVPPHALDNVESAGPPSADEHGGFSSIDAISSLARILLMGSAMSGLCATGAMKGSEAKDSEWKCSQHDHNAEAPYDEERVPEVLPQISPRKPQGQP